MARSDDKKDDKRKPSAPGADGGRSGQRRVKSDGNAASPAAPGKKAPAARPAPKGSKAAAPAPRARRTTRTAAEGPGKARPASPPPAPKATTRRAAAKPAAPKGPAAKKPAMPRKRAAAPKVDAGGQPPPSVLDEEERIEDAKYQPRALPRRLFEEERFIFPESYGQSRIRLLVKDPDWLFAHWDVDPQSLADLRAELGERASALSNLTLRVVDPQHGGESRVLLPDGARSWYVRADAVQRSYRAELGLTLPSGEFRSLAQSNTVTTPRSGPARSGGPRRMRYDGLALPPAGAPPASTVRPAAAPAAAGPGPWRPDPSTTQYPGPVGRVEESAEERGTGRRGEPSGGASDVYRR